MVGGLLAGGIGLGLVLTFKDFASKGMKGAERAFKDLDNATSASAEKSFKAAQLGMKVGTGMMLAGGMVAVAMLSNVKIAMQYEDTLNAVRIATGFTGKQMAWLAKETMKAAGPLPGSASDLAKIQERIGMMGIATRIGAKGVLDFSVSMLQMKSALKVQNIEEVTDSLSRLLDMYDMSGDKAKNLASSLAYVKMQTGTAADEMATGAEQAMGMFKAFNVTAPSLIAVTGFIRKMGYSVQVGGTALARFLTLASAKVEMFSKFMGVSTAQWTSMLKTDATSAIVAFLTKLQGMDAVSRMAALQNMHMAGKQLAGTFTNMAMKVDFLKKLMEGANKAFLEGTLLFRLFGEQSRTLEFKMEAFKGSVESARTAIGLVLIPTVGVLLDFFNKIISVFTSMPTWMQKGIVILTMAAAVFTVVAGAIVFLLSGVVALVALWPVITAALSTALPVLAAIAGAVLGIGLAFAAIGILIYEAWINNWGGFATKLKKGFDFIKTAAMVFWQFVTTGFADKSLMDKLGGPFSNVGTIVRKVAIYVRNVITAAKAFWKEFQKIGAVLAPVFKSLMEAFGKLGVALGFIFGAGGTKKINDTSNSWKTFGKIAADILMAIIYVVVRFTTAFIKFQLVCVAVFAVFIKGAMMIYSAGFKIESVLVKAWQAVGRAAIGIWDGIKAAWGSGINWIINAWNKIPGHDKVANVGTKPSKPKVKHDTGGSILSHGISLGTGGLPRGIPVPILAEAGERVAPVGAAGAESLSSPFSKSGGGGGADKLMIQIPIYLDKKQLHAAMASVELDLKRRTFRVHEATGRGTI